MTGREPEIFAPPATRGSPLRQRFKVWIPRLIATLAAAALAGGLWNILDADSPLLDSPLPQYFLGAIVGLTFLVASLSTGLALVRWLLPARLRFEERVVVAFGLGVLAFQTGVFLLGVCGGLNQLGGILLASAFTLFGARPTWRIVRLGRKVAGAPRLPRVATVSPVLLGIGALLLAYALGHALTTDSIGYDSNWYHLPVAEAYAGTGRIRAFAEGWTLGAQPQLAGLVYAWAIAVAGSSALGLTSAAMTELCFVFVAIFGVVPLTRLLLSTRRRVHWAWVAMALFPALLRYPPRIEADYHVAALSVPLLIVAFKLWERVDERSLAAGAFSLAGVAMVKATAVLVFPLPFVVAGAGCVRQVWASRRAHPLAASRLVLRSLGVAVAAFVIATSSFWLKNWAFYGDPLFPTLTKPQAFTETALAAFRTELHELWVPAPGVDGWNETLRALFTFSFKPHEYTAYNAGHPMFGSLFSLTLPALLLLWPLRRARRAFVVHVGVLVGVLAWYRIHHQDRYLLALVPWMAAVTAATLAELWPHLVSRGIVIATCIVQLAIGLRWGVQFFPLESLRSVLWAPSVAAWEARQTARWSNMARVGSALGPRDKVLLHDERIRLGLRRASVTDGLGFETRLSLGELANDALVFDKLKSLGVTHLYTPRNTSGFDTIAGDLVYNSFARRWGLATTQPDLRRMPTLRPSAASAERFAYVSTCGASARPAGLYRVRDLNDEVTGMPAWKRPQPSTPSNGMADAAPLLARADFAVIDRGCSMNQWTSAQNEFELLVTRAGHDLYVRHRERPTRP